jgi:hypothetical protein
MPILNYTTSVPVTRTVGQIQGLLVEAGARALMAEYDDVGNITGMSFAVTTPFGKQGYTLPVKTERVLAVLVRDKVSPRYRTPEHAEEVAWRILKDWVEAQLALLKTEMVTLDQVMLPYMRTQSGRTVYELYLEDQLSLPAGSDVDA